MSEIRKFSKISGEAALIFSGQFGAVILQLLILRLLTSLLSVSEYGLLSLLLVSATFIERTFMVVQAGVARYYLEAVQKNKLQFYWLASVQLLLRSSLFSLLAGISVISVIPLLAPFHHQASAVLILIAAIVSGWNTALSGIILSARKRFSHAFFQLSDFTCRLALIYIFTNCLGASLLGISLAYVLAAAFLCVLQYIIVAKLLRIRIAPKLKNLIKNNSISVREWKAHIWKYSSPFLAWGGFSWMQQSSDRFALETFSGSPAVGFYSIIFQLGYTPMTILGTMMITLIQPILFSRASPNAGFNRANNSSLMHIPLISSLSLLLISAILALVAFSYHDLILSLFVTEDFRSYSRLLPLAVLAGGIFAAAQPFGMRLMAMKQTIQIFWINTIFSVVSISFNFIGAYFYGIPGVVSALLFSSCLYWMLFFFLVLNPKQTTLRI